jgi:hypothetical protein
MNAVLHATYRSTSAKQECVYKIWKQCSGPAVIKIRSAVIKLLGANTKADTENITEAILPLSCDSAQSLENKISFKN